MITVHGKVRGPKEERTSKVRQEEDILQAFDSLSLRQMCRSASDCTSNPQFELVLAEFD